MVMPFAVGKIDLRDKFDNPVIGRSNDIALIGDNSTINSVKSQKRLTAIIKLILEVQKRDSVKLPPLLIVLR